jgi:hypothetical protein
MRLILDERNEDWEEMGPRFKDFHRKIKLETEETILRAEIEYKAHHEEPT